MEALGIVVVLWVWTNLDFITTKNEQIAQGYDWVETDCREPDTSVPHFTIKGKICYKLIK